MIDVNRATEIARKSLVELLGKQEIADENGITLEEFELVENKKFWNITLGYPVRELPRRGAVPKSLVAILAEEPRRRFKTFKIDAREGDLVAMKYAER
jgi:hypothetical protein